MSDNPMLRWSFAHERTPHSVTYYIRNRYKRRQRVQRITVPVSPLPTVAEVADVSHLIATYYEMQGKAGRAPGPDGVTYADLGGREVADILRTVSKSVCDETYRPGRTRKVQIPKLSGGTRTLSIGNLIDRVVAAALHRALEPRWESIFLPCSMGFRPHRGVWRMLAQIGVAIQREKLFVLGQDDIRNAFPSVILADVLADHTRSIQDKSLLSLVEVVLRGGDFTRVRGIDQGCPYSPTALNVRLHHAVDLAVFQGHHPSRYFRYADNLVWMCRDVSDGNQFHDLVRQLLNSNGFNMKGDNKAVDLSQGSAELLGFTLSMSCGRLQFQPGKDAWIKLDQQLTRSHGASNPALAARNVVQGWISAHGPAFASWRSSDRNRLRATLDHHGIRDGISPEHVRVWSQTAWERWITYRNR